MTVSFSISKDKLPFLDRQEVVYQVEETPAESSEPIIARIREMVCSIRMEISPSNMISFGQAMTKYGEQKGIKAALHLAATQAAEKETFFCSECFGIDGHRKECSEFIR